MSRIEIIMECTHVAVFTVSTPRVGERIYCVRCTDMRKVTGAPGDYRATCDHCTGLYLTRRTPEALRRQVMKHLTENGAHMVTVWRIGIPDVVKVSLRSPVGVLDGLDDPDTLAFGA